MRIAIPTSGGQMAEHFGHCEAFTFIDIEAGSKSIIGTSEVPAPEHQPGLLPAWLGERGVKLIIASGMGSRALRLFEQSHIGVLTGAPRRDPLALAREYLEGTLAGNSGSCTHSHAGHKHCGG